MREIVYISISGENLICRFYLDDETGKLSDRKDFSITIGPTSLAVSPDGIFLYVGLRGEGGIATCRIDPQTGDLDLLSKFSLKEGPCFLSVDKSGKFLLSSYYQGGNVAVHPIGQDGTAGSNAVDWRETAPNAHSITTDPSNRFAFVAHTEPNKIFQFYFDPTSGRLNLNPAPGPSSPKGAGPRHFCFHPNGNFLFFSNELGSGVSSYKFNREEGTLSLIKTLSTLPQSFEKKNTCAQIHNTPDGRYLYVSNRGHDSIASFAVDPDTGDMTSVDHTPTEKTPRVFNVVGNGKYLIVGGGGTGRIATYRIDPATGNLEPLEIIEIGKSPMWILPYILQES